MNLDDCTVYVFVRQDIPIAQQIVQACHAAFHVCFSWQRKEWIGIPFIVAIGMPNLSSLQRARKKLDENRLEYFAFEDSDFNFPDGPMSAIATAPLTKEQKTVLANYRLWNHKNCKEFSFPLSSAKEHSEFNGEVGGSSPSAGATLNSEAAV
jgi:hypothetical protein